MRKLIVCTAVVLIVIFLVVFIMEVNPNLHKKQTFVTQKGEEIKYQLVTKKVEGVEFDYLILDMKCNNVYWVYY